MCVDDILCQGVGLRDFYSIEGVYRCYIWQLLRVSGRFSDYLTFYPRYILWYTFFSVGVVVSICGCAHVCHSVYWTH